jgi:hypothetical protein
MTNAEMHAIQVHNTPVFLKRTLSPGVKLLGERLIETTDRDFHWERLPATFGPLLLLCGCSSCNEHLGETFCDVQFKATVAVKDLRVELAFAVSGYVETFQSTRRRC